MGKLIHRSCVKPVTFGCASQFVAWHVTHAQMSPLTWAHVRSLAHSQMHYRALLVFLCYDTVVRDCPRQRGHPSCFGTQRPGPKFAHGLGTSTSVHGQILQQFRNQRKGLQTIRKIWVQIIGASVCGTHVVFRGASQFSVPGPRTNVALELNTQLWK